jgi:hypothetical protein
MDYAAGGDSGAGAEQHAADRRFAEIDRETARSSIEDKEFVEPSLG